jgi:LuxR family transcriptional regulator
MERHLVNALELSKQSANFEDVFDSFSIQACELGFEFCSIKIFCDHLAVLPIFDRSSFPNEWSEHFKRHYECRDTPVMKHCLESVLPVLWNAQVFHSAPNLWEDMCRFSLQNGLSVAVHDPLGIVSVFCFSRKAARINPVEFYELSAYLLWLANHTHASLTACLRQVTSLAGLSSKEREILHWTAEGKSAAETGIILRITERTVNFHLHNIMCKFNVRNKTAAVIHAVRRKLI